MRRAMAGDRQWRSRTAGRGGQVALATGVLQAIQVPEEAMSAVSAEFPHASADVVSPSRQADGRPGAQSGDGHEGPPRATAGKLTADFGANEWLVDELYQRYQADPASVDRAWWNFFADYRPVPTEVVRPERAQASAPPPAQGVQPGGGPVAPSAPARSDGPATTVTTNGHLSAPAPAAAAPAPSDGANSTRLRGAAARTVANMEASLSVPTATSVRAVPAKLLIDNRIVINNHLARGRGGKVSFTHLIGYAIVRALVVKPELNESFAEVDGKPMLVRPEHVNLGLAIDVRKDDGSRQLLVPSIKGAEKMDFRQFWLSYEDIVRRARSGKLTVDDFAGTTISLTNPGTIGTEHSVPRLMSGQGAIIGVGAMEYPAAFAGASAETLARNAISQTVTLTSTYDHRI